MITQIDFAILDFIQDLLKSPVADSFFRFMTRLGDGGVLFIATAIVLILFKKTRKSGFAMAIALIISFIVCNLVLKNLVARIRPFDLREVGLIIAKPKDYSFPSGHSWHAFACAAVLGAYYKKYRVWFYIAAFLIAFSRLYLYVHYPTDVIGGAILGALTGMLAVKLVNRCTK